MAKLPEAGDLFEGKYRIEHEIGSGGFAAVFRGVDQATGRAVAIKILIPLQHEDDYSERLTARFEREARLLAGLRSQHTVTLYEFGRSVDDLLYLVFEFVDGTTLGDLVRLKGAQAPERVVSILRQTCTALHEAHLSGILHRDIKPANIMVYDHLEMRDVVKLLDFGIAKPIATTDLADVADETITTMGAVLGTPRYMSPEQLARQELTPASDIYSLGLVAYELLMGERAINEETVTGILRAQLAVEAIEFPRDRGIPRGLRTVVEKMLARRPGERYQDLSVVVRDLEDWDDADMSLGVMRLSIAGLVVGAALLVAAFFLADGRRDVQAAPVEREVITLGTPAWSVPLDSPGVTYAWLGSSVEYELKGGDDPRAISPSARAVIAVERTGVPIVPGKRFIGNLLDWDGRSLDTSIVVFEVDEPTFQAMGHAQIDALGVARPLVARVSTRALESALEFGLPIDVTALGWERWVEPKDLKAARPEDSLRLKTDWREVDFLAAKAKSIRAQSARDWTGVLRACGPLAGHYRDCAMFAARAHRERDEFDEACYWYRWIEETPSGFECLSTGTRPSYTDLPPER